MELTDLNKTMILMAESGQIQRFKQNLPGWIIGFFVGFMAGMLVLISILPN